MQLGHESSNRLQPNIDQQLIDGAQLQERRTANEDSRLMQLDLMICGQSKVIRTLKKSILRAADCSSTVLITGESGTGKELIARSIHELGARQGEPFLAINCGALTESLLESELFGHVKGASPAPPATRKECSSPRVRELSSWMNLAKCHRRCRCVYYECFRNTRYAQ